MSDLTDALIGRLATELRPVRRLPKPWMRAAIWLAVLAVGAVVLALSVNLGAAAARIGSAPDMWLSVVGSVITAILAAVAACALSVPGYSARWAWLPLPGVALWLGASGTGCLRGVALAALHKATWNDALLNCLPFILEGSAVLAIPMAILLWWARPLRPGLVAAVGGLAVAAGAASLLWMVHPFDASYEDLIVHTAAVGAVVLLARLAGGVAARRRPMRPATGSPAR